MKCDECIHNDVCSLTHSSDNDACEQIVPTKHIEELEHKLEWLLSYITDGLYSKSSYTIEEMQSFVDDKLDDIENIESMRTEGEIDEYKDDILNLREENAALKDAIVKMVMERMGTK